MGKILQGSNLTYTMGKILQGSNLAITPWAISYREQSKHCIMVKIIQGTF
jgi:hypothetical protein